jgi:hypothetical protein
MGGAARHVSVALLEAPSHSHAAKPPTDEAEGAGKEEEAGVMHSFEVRSHASRVKCPIN